MSAGAGVPGGCRDAVVVDLLGSGSGNPTATRDTTSLLVGAAAGWTLVDCPGSVIQKLARRRVDARALRRVILTHDHVDHVYGLPHLVHALAVAGGCESVGIWAPAETLATVEEMVRTHDLKGDRYPRLDVAEISVGAPTEILCDGGLRVIAAAADHTRPTVALRFETAEASICYSADTRPCDSVARLARRADVLFHDCGGPERLRQSFAAAHSSAADAAAVAGKAGVGALVLTHLGARDDDVLAECLAEASAAFSGPVELGRDGARWLVPEVGEATA